MEKIFYTVDEVQKVLSIGRNKAYEYCENGTIPAVRIGKLWRIPIKALHEQFETNQRDKYGNTNTKRNK